MSLPREAQLRSSVGSTSPPSGTNDSRNENTMIAIATIRLSDDHGREADRDHADAAAQLGESGVERDAPGAAARASSAEGDTRHQQHAAEQQRRDGEVAEHRDATDRRQQYSATEQQRDPGGTPRSFASAGSASPAFRAQAGGRAPFARRRPGTGARDRSADQGRRPAPRKWAGKSAASLTVSWPPRPKSPPSRRSSLWRR